MIRPAFRVPKTRGFSVIEVMITVVIIAIAVALAVPSWMNMVEKRRLTHGMETVASFIYNAQSEAIKRNEEVTVAFRTPGGHNRAWCIGAALGDVSCDCRVTAPGAGFCEIDNAPQRLVQADFTRIDHEFMHMRPNVGSFTFDPVRGLISDTSEDEVTDNDYLFYVHSDQGSGSTRMFELELWLNETGRVSICADSDGRASIIAGYPEC
jgi:prepilin-type N-terminal cleavage/methylation domain-containing protein